MNRGDSRELGLARALLRLGHVLAFRGPWARLRGVAIAAGTGLLVFSAFAVVLAGSYEGLRQQRADAIRPDLVASETAPADLLYSFDGFTQVGDRQVTVVSLWPLTASAPLPPGVAAWPRPGEAVLSPQLLADLGPGGRDLFGPVAGLIGPEGVEVPTERRVYLRPSTATFDAGTMQRASGFGHRSDSAYYGVGILNAALTWQVLSLLLAALAGPGLVALALGAGLDGEARDRRTRLLTALGAGRRHQALVDAAEAAPAVLLGAALAAVVLTAMSLHDVSLPHLDAVLASDAARRVAPQLLGAGVAGTLVALGVVVLLRQRRGSRRQRQHALEVAQAVPWGRAGLCVGAVLGTVWVTANSHTSQVRTMFYVAGSLLVAVTLPAVVSAVVAVIGEAAGGWGLRSGSPGTLAGGRHLHHFPRRTVRLALGLGFAILALGQVQLWASQLGAQYHQALETRARFGNTVAVAGHTSYGPGMKSYLADLPAAAQPVWVAIEAPAADDPRQASRAHLFASCPTLRTLGLPCASTDPIAAGSVSPRLQQVLGFGIGAASTKVTMYDQPDLADLQRREATLMLVSPTINGLPMADLQRTGYRELPGGLQLATLEQGWVTQGQVLLTRASWTVLLGSIGLVVVALAGACALAGDTIAGGSALRRLSRVSARSRWVYVLTLWRTALPLLVVGSLAAAIYLILPSGLGQGEVTMSPSTTLAGACVLAAGLVATASSAWAARRITHDPDRRV